MVQVFLGLSGSGKTKEMIRAINETADNSNGSVVCIENGSKLRYDVNYRVRLIEYGVYGLQGADALKAFISGLHAGNFDITHIFIKSLHRLLGTEDGEKLAAFCDWCERFGSENGVDFSMTARQDPATAPESLKKYL